MLFIPCVFFSSIHLLESSKTYKKNEYFPILINVCGLNWPVTIYIETYKKNVICYDGGRGPILPSFLFLNIISTKNNEKKRPVIITNNKFEAIFFVKLDHNCLPPPPLKVGHFVSSAFPITKAGIYITRVNLCSYRVVPNI